MNVFPAAFPLRGLKIVVAGEGEAADAKARLFAGSPARVVRLAVAQARSPEMYAGARLAFIALPGEAASRAAQAARTAGALVNVVDRPELCDFNTPAIVDRGAVVGAIATGGAAPLLAAELRRELEARWPSDLGAVARLIETLQGEVRTALPAVAERRAWLRRLLDGPTPALAMGGEMAAALALARAGLAAAPAAGRLSLLVPPASPDLISLRALQALSRADRVLAAEGVDEALLALARRDAPIEPSTQARPAVIAEEVAAGGSVVCIGPAHSFVAFGALERLPVSA